MLPDMPSVIGALIVAHWIGAVLGLATAATADGLGLRILFTGETGPGLKTFERLHTLILVALGLLLASGGALIALRMGAWCERSDGPGLVRFGSFCLPSKLIAKLVVMSVLVGVALLIETHLLPFVRRSERPLLPHLSMFDVVRSAFIGSTSLTCWLSLIAIPLATPLHNLPAATLLGTIAAVWAAMATSVSLGLVVLRLAMRRSLQPIGRYTGAAVTGTGLHLAPLARLQTAEQRPDERDDRVVPFHPAHRPQNLPTRQGAQGQPDRAPVTPSQEERGASSVEAAFAACRPAIFGTAAISLVMNVLMLSGPLYMLQVYDRVLTSRSLETLTLLTVLLVGLYLAFGVLDTLRARVLSRISIRLDRLLSGTLIKRAVQPGPAKSTATAGRLMGDLEQIRQFVAGPAPSAMLDLPWTPLYFGILFLLHPLLGLAAIAGAVVLVALSLANQLLTLKPLARAAEENQRSSVILEAGRRNAEALQSMGMAQAHRWRWLDAHRRALSQQLRAGDIASSASAASKISRMLLQSLMLALGAYLSIQGSVSAGAMIASSILATRALAPVEQLVAQWRAIEAVRAALRRCRESLKVKGPSEDQIALPYPQGDLAVRNLYVSAIGETETVLKGLTFRLAPGDAVAVVGPSASGKSTLARALVGVWPVRHGEIRLDGAALAQWPADQLGRLVGYLPQEASLFDGTIAENIARLDPNPDPEAVITAAAAAGVHDMIVRLTDGYNTQVGDGGAVLSGGQRQRIALARALYGEPALVVMDEPNANLDNEGEAALVAAITRLRQTGCIVVVMAHRHSVLTAVNRVLVLNEGRQVAFGAPNDVLRGPRTSPPLESVHGPVRVAAGVR
jgi:ATP-binding cassette, subfamily C, bacterial PrsD